MRKYKVSGMSCAACSCRVESAVSALTDVDECSVNLLTGIMVVEGSAPDEEIIDAVKKSGYGATFRGEKIRPTQQKNKEVSEIRIQLIASVVILIPLLYISIGYMMLDLPLPGFLSGNALSIAISELILSGMILVVNQRFFKRGFKGIIHKSPNMDTLIALGSTASFAYSTVILFLMSSVALKGSLISLIDYIEELYFDSSAIILIIVTIGKLLEAKSKGKTTDALVSLMKLTPETAVVIRDGEEKKVLVEKVKIGDRFIVKAGDSIPVDGIVTDGTAAVNEAALTGESVPVEKSLGDEVQAGTVNQNGFLECEAVRVGEDTSLSKIIDMVENAGATKAPVAKAADKVSAIFVPCVLALALITLSIWVIMGYAVGYALVRAVSVLVISCPCALGLATPVAIMVGNGKAAKNGILFKTATSLEMAGKSQIAVLDKTGTLTTGEPVVKKMITAEGVSEKELMEFAYSLEKKSEHPFARAIIKEGKDRRSLYYDVNEFKVTAGNGVSAIIHGESAVGGNLDFVSRTVTVDDVIAYEADEIASSGMTPLLFAGGGKILGIIAVADAIKSDTRKAVEELKTMGLYTIMLTGDNAKTTERVAEEAGVDDWIADVKPEDKAKTVKKLQERASVVMVGDGINDAPALTQADIGIAVASGTDVAIDAADVVLVKNSIKDVAAALRLSRATVRNIHQNLFWAFLYNIIGIPLAAGCFIPVFGIAPSPVFAAAAMGLSSILVVGNALRLNACNPRNTARYVSFRRSVRKEFEAEKDIADSDETKEINAEKERSNAEMKITINGMSCPHCEARMKKALEEVDGIENASCSHEKNEAEIETSKDVSVDVIEKVVTDAGYEFKGCVK